MKIAISNAPPDRADEIARALVSGGYAACVNLGPVRSVYRWKGEVCEEPEVTLWIKVSDAGVEALRERLLELHPYQLPEFVVVPVEAEGSLGAYQAWVEAECTRDGGA